MSTNRRRTLEAALTDTQRKAAIMYNQNNWSTTTREDGKKLNQAELAQEIGISRSTLYEYRSNPDWIAYVNYLSDIQMEGMHSEFHQLLIKSMRGGPNGVPSTKGLELFARYHGLLKNVEVKIDANDNGGNNIDVDALRERVEALQLASRG